MNKIILMIVMTIGLSACKTTQVKQPINKTETEIFKDEMYTVRMIKIEVKAVAKIAELDYLKCKKNEHSCNKHSIGKAALNKFNELVEKNKQLTAEHKVSAFNSVIQ
jgi:hypothetical protein